MDREAGLAALTAAGVGVGGGIVVPFVALEEVGEEAEQRDEEGDRGPLPAAHAAFGGVDVRVRRETGEPRERDAEEDSGDERFHTDASPPST
ncbi:hypothetical protein [Halorubrum sp. CBA1125]|uniref:hypothetical protein n=1 Tax=Halorubrum sp. CBA1125 TaxID=2668072 RepID=UPI0037440800